MDIFTLTMTPINPPADDSVKNMAMGLVKNVKRHRFIFISYAFGSAFERCENVKFIRSPFQRPGKHSMSLLQKLFAFFVIMTSWRRIDLFQFFVTPQAYFSRFFRWFFRRTGKRSIIILSSINTLGRKNKTVAIKDLFFSDRVVTYTDFSKKELEALGVKNVVRIYPGIDIDRFDPRNVSSSGIVPYKGKKILYAGAYSILDGSYSFGDLCSIVEGVSNVRKDVIFVMACRIRTAKDIVLEKKFKAMAGKRGLTERFVFLNTVKDMAGLIKECDIGIMPAKARMAGVLETPMVLLETACMSKCVIYTDVAPLNELHDNGIGIMLPSQSPAYAYVNVILDIIGDERKYAEIAACSSSGVRENFSITRMADKYSELYDSLKG